MTGTPVDLLSMLASGLRAVGSAVGGGPQNLSRSEIEGARFSELLGRAQSGEFSSELQIKVDHSLDLKLTDDQLDRLAHIADQAEAAGAKSVLVLIDGMALKLDVSQRTIVDEVNLSDGAVLSGIDAVVSAGEVDGGGGKGIGSAILPLPNGLGGTNPTLLHALAEVERVMDGHGVGSRGSGEPAKSGSILSKMLSQL